MDALFFADAARPDEGRIRTPDLNPAWKIRLFDVQLFLRWFGLQRPDAASVADGVNRIADGRFGIAEVPAAAGAEMPPVRMNAEPVPVQMRIAAIRTRNVLHPIPEHRRDHVINGVELGDEN